MRSYLVVGNQTLGSPTLAAAIIERRALGPATFHVVVPATPIKRGLTWDEDEAREVARERLDVLVAGCAAGNRGHRRDWCARPDRGRGGRDPQPAGRRDPAIDLAVPHFALARPGRSVAAEGVRDDPGRGRHG